MQLQSQLQLNLISDRPGRQPRPWRMAELEEAMHTAENRQREWEMRRSAVAASAAAASTPLISSKMTGSSEQQAKGIKKQLTGQAQKAAGDIKEVVKNGSGR